MNKLIREIPIPISGVMLSLAALGNLIKPLNGQFRDFLGIVSAVIFILLLLKIITNFEQIKNGFNNPIIAGVMSTFPMTMMILSTYIVKYNLIFALVFFSSGILIHLIIIILFTNKYIFDFDLVNVYPTNFIVYTGVVCASVASPALGIEIIGRILFWLGLVGLLIMLPIVTKRIIKNSLPKKVSPTLAIYAAPASLCLAGYISSYGIKNNLIVYGLLILATMNLIFVLIRLPKILKIEFNPTFAALTFPFVITAIAIKMSGVLNLYASLTQAIAIGFVGYVFIMFIKTIFSNIIQKELVISKV